MILAGLSNVLPKMPPSALFSRPLALAGFVYATVLCIISLGSSLKVFSSPTLAGQSGLVGPVVKRTWDSEQGPFSGGPPQDSVIVEEEGQPAKVDTSTSDGPERLGIPGLGNPLPPLNSIVTSVLGGSTVTVPVPGLPTPPVASGDLFNSVVSILAAAPTAAPTSPGGNGGPLGGLLSALSQVTPVSVVPTASAGLLPAFDVLGGVAAALDNVLGSSEDNDSLDGGLLGQLSANVVAPVASIAADPASILAHPSAALDNLQSRVSSVLDSLPSAMAAGIQFTNNVGGQIADALDATTEVLDSVPDVAAGVADQVGSLLNAAPNLATGLPAAALSAVNQVESVLATDPDVVGDLTGILGGLKNELSSAIVNAVPEVTSLAAAVGAHVVDVLPPVLQGPVQGALSSLQNDVSGLLCQVSDVVSGTAIIFNVPCGSVRSVTSDPGDPGAKTLATTPAAASASITVGETLPLAPTPASSLSRQPLASILSSLGSVLTTAETTGASVVDPAANSALSGLSSLFSHISELSLTAADTPSTPPTPVAPPTGELFAIPLASSDADLF
ncbi:hypothetical protein SLS63_013952 [Diaporthe eres]|uniref:Uncharacterized protein n=1 Tax=Diaporthe eres TaxID=83184 RepID=A0ABR1NM11_DIAER